MLHLKPNRLKRPKLVPKLVKEHLQNLLLFLIHKTLVHLYLLKTLGPQLLYQKQIVLYLATNSSLL